MVNGILAAEIGPVVWGIPANFNGLRVLAGRYRTVLQQWASAKLCGVDQRAGQLSRWALAHILVIYSLLFSWL